MELEKIGAQLIGIGVTPLLEFFWEGTMQPFSLFLEVCGIGPFPHVLKFSTLGITFLNFKLSCFWLTFSRGIRVDGRQERGQTFELTKENG